MPLEKRYRVPPEGVAEFLQFANVSRYGPQPPDPMDFKIQTKRGRRAYLKALEATAQKLREVPFCLEGDADAVVSFYSTWGKPVREVLVALTQAKPGEPVPFNIPASQLHDAVVQHDGRVKVSPSNLEGEAYELFLQVLKGLNREYLHLCPICGNLFWARVDKRVCSGRCRVVLYRKNNPDGWLEIQARYEGKRAGRELAQKQEKDAEKQEKDAEERRRLKSVHAPSYVRGKKKDLTNT